jgi:YbbR domain-containing protein
MLHRNLLLKTTSLLLAIFLWFWVLLNEENPIIEAPVKVEVTTVGLSPRLALQRTLPTVEIRVRGLKQDVSEVTDQVDGFVSCRDLEAGSYRLAVQPRAPENVTVTNIRPPEVPVVLEEVVSETRPVDLRLVGEPPAGYELIGAEQRPQVVRLSGPRSRVDRAARVLVTMDLGRAVPEVPVSVPVRPVDSSGNKVDRVDASPPRVNVLVTMKLVVSSRTVPVAIKTRGALPGDVKIASVRVEPPMVTIMGPASRVQEVNEIETEKLSLSGVRDSFARSIHLIVPEDVNLLTESSVKVSVEVEQVAPVPSPAAEPAEPQQ